MTPAMADSIITYQRMISVHSFLVVSGVICPFVLFFYYLWLHIRIDRASKISMELFPERWSHSKQHICLISIRLAIIYLFVCLANNMIVLAYPVPPFVSYEFLADKIWAVQNLDKIKYYRSMDISKHAESMISYFLILVVGHFINNSISAMTRKRKDT